MIYMRRIDMISIKTRKVPFLCTDVIFKSLFIENPNILGKMISDIADIDYIILKDNIILETNEIPIKRKDERFKKCDFIVRLDPDKVINIEINTSKYKTLKIKNLSYSFELFATNTSKGEDYNENFKLIQINLNCYRESTKDVLVEYGLISNDNNHINYIDNYKILMLNIYKAHEIYYNETNRESIPNYIKWGEFLYNEEIDKIPKILDGVLESWECEIVMKKIGNLMTAEESY